MSLLIAIADPNFPEIQGTDASSELSDYTFLNGAKRKAWCCVRWMSIKIIWKNQHATQQASMKTISSPLL